MTPCTLSAAFWADRLAIEVKQSSRISKFFILGILVVLASKNFGVYILISSENQLPCDIIQWLINFIQC